MNCCLQKYTTHQFTYVLYHLFQDKFKNTKMMKIQQVHQKIHAKQFLLTGFYPSPKSFWSCTHVNICSKDTLYQYTYFIEYFIQGNSKYPRIKKIH